MKWMEIYFFIIVLIGIIALGVLMTLTPSEAMINVLKEFGGM